MRRIIAVALACIPLAACGGGAKSLSGSYFMQDDGNGGGVIQSMDFKSNGAVDVATVMGVQHTTYKFDGDQVTMTLTLPPLPFTFKMDSAGCLVVYVASVTPYGDPPKFCKKA